MVLIAMPSFGGRAPADAIGRLKNITGNGAMVSVVALAIKKACLVRKENELFL